jgi:coenzyme Q-binding protein COQ10
MLWIASPAFDNVPFLECAIGDETAVPAIHVKRRVHHSAEQMFDLVADVERYPEFVPFCQKHSIVSRNKSGDTEILITDMTVGRGFLRETIRSRDTLDRKNGHILIEGLAGPLQRLQTRWSFQPQDDRSCEVGFDLDYEISNRLLKLLLGDLLDAAFRRFVPAFEHRADIIYGRRSHPLLGSHPVANGMGAKGYDGSRERRKNEIVRGRAAFRRLQLM